MVHRNQIDEQTYRLTGWLFDQLASSAPVAAEASCILGFIGRVWRIPVSFPLETVSIVVYCRFSLETVCLASGVVYFG